MSSLFSSARATGTAAKQKRATKTIAKMANLDQTVAGRDAERRARETARAIVVEVVKEKGVLE
jgi:hypothetical protein